MSGETARIVAEIMHTSEPCCNVVEGNGLCPDNCKVWTTCDGKVAGYGATPPEDHTVDDMLAWLRDQEAATLREALEAAVVAVGGAS